MEFTLHIYAKQTYYLPQHVVVKAIDPQSKIRVVFNASFYITSGVLLNDVLLPRLKLQQDVRLIFSRWII